MIQRCDYEIISFGGAGLTKVFKHYNAFTAPEAETSKKSKAEVLFGLVTLH